MKKIIALLFIIGIGILAIYYSITTDYGDYVIVSCEKEKLEKLINLPVPIDSCIYEFGPRIEVRKGRTLDIGPTDYELTAVLCFSDSNFAKMEKYLEKKNDATIRAEWMLDRVKKSLWTDGYLHTIDTTSSFYTEAFGRGTLRRANCLRGNNNQLLIIMLAD